MAAERVFIHPEYEKGFNKTANVAIILVNFIKFSTIPQKTKVFHILGIPNRPDFSLVEHSDHVS